VNYPVTPRTDILRELTRTRPGVGFFRRLSLSHRGMEEYRDRSLGLYLTF